MNEIEKLKLARKLLVSAYDELGKKLTIIDNILKDSYVEHIKDVRNKKLIKE